MILLESHRVELTELWELFRKVYHRPTEVRRTSGESWVLMDVSATLAFLATLSEAGELRVLLTIGSTRQAPLLASVTEDLLLQRFAHIPIGAWDIHAMPLNETQVAQWQSAGIKPSAQSNTYSIRQTTAYNIFHPWIHRVLLMPGDEKAPSFPDILPRIVCRECAIRAYAEPGLVQPHLPDWDEAARRHTVRVGRCCYCNTPLSTNRASAAAADLSTVVTPLVD